MDIGTLIMTNLTTAIVANFSTMAPATNFSTVQNSTALWNFTSTTAELSPSSLIPNSTLTSTLATETILSSTPMSTIAPASNFTSISVSTPEPTITGPLSKSVLPSNTSMTAAPSTSSTTTPTTASSSTTTLPTTSTTEVPSTISTTVAPSTTASTSELPATSTSTALPTTSTASSTTSTTASTTAPPTTSPTEEPTTTSTTTVPTTKMTTTTVSTISTTLPPPSSKSTKTAPPTPSIPQPITEDNTTLLNTNLTVVDILTEIDMPDLTPANVEVVQNVVQIYRYIPRDCCITLPYAIITLVVFALIVATIIAIWLLCVAFLRRREKIYCMESMQKVNDDMYRNGKPSKQGGQFMPGPVVMTPEFKMEQFLKNMQNKPAPITTDEKCIGGVLNFLAHNPIEDEVIYRPGRQDVVLEPRDLPFKGGTKAMPTHRNALPESEVASIPEKHRSKHHRNGVEIDSENEPVLFGGRDLNHTKSAPRKIKQQNMNALKRTFKKKRSKKPRKPTPAGILPPPKSPATTPPQPMSPNPYRSKDRVVYKDGTHYRA